MGLIEAGLPAHPDSPLRAALGTDTGRRREHNEDAVGAYLPPDDTRDPPVDAALVVADGVGGHEGGAWASTFVVDATRDTIEAQPSRIADLDRWLDRLLHSIHEELLREARARGTPASMGSTATLAVIQGRALTLAHVGDSRAYRLRNGRMEQLTQDDSWVAEQVRAGVLSSDDPEAESRKNVLTQCLGIGASLAVQIIDDHISPGDRYLLCSDGLHGEVSDEELERMLAAGHAPDVTSSTLIALANERGGPDNISAVVFDIGTPPTYRAHGATEVADSASAARVDAASASGSGGQAGPAGQAGAGGQAGAAGLNAGASTRPWEEPGNGAEAPSPGGATQHPEGRPAVGAGAAVGPEATVGAVAAVGAGATSDPVATAAAAGRRRANWVSGAGAVMLVLAAGSWLAGQTGPSAARNADALAAPDLSSAGPARPGAADAAGNASDRSPATSMPDAASVDPELPGTSTTSPTTSADPSEQPDPPRNAAGDSAGVVGRDTTGVVGRDSAAVPPDTTMIPNEGVLPRDSMTAPDTVPPDTTTTRQTHRPHLAQERPHV